MGLEESPCGLPKGIKDRLKACKKAALELRVASPEKKNAVLAAAVRLLLEKKTLILDANAEDLKALSKEATPAFRDRLMIDEKRLGQMVESLRQVSKLSDPVGEEVEKRVLQNGLKIRRVRSPLGVVLMIFESRPNVATETFSLAFKAGNVIILRGGKESMRTTGALYEVLTAALHENGFSTDTFWGIQDPDRSLVLALLRQKHWIDVVVPRGGDSLIEFVVENSLIPIIKNDRGLCHVYVHEDADLKMALEIVTNAKCQRPGVCNSMETVLVHKKMKDKFIPALYECMAPLHVEWYGAAEVLELLEGKAKVHAATQESWDTEYLDLKMNCRAVNSLDEAIAHIERHGSGHSESIVTSSEAAARKFQSEIDAAVVYWNASTRFTDGFEMGLGGELGISTQKLHVRGPVGLRELTSVRWIVDGNGQVRTK